MIYLYGLKAVHGQANFGSFDEFTKHFSANTGNAAFVFALHEVLRLTGASKRWGDRTGDLSPDEDILLLPLANHLGSHVDMSKMLERLDRSSAVPIVVVGLGAQLALSEQGVEAIPSGSWDMVDYLTSRAPSDHPNITVRGATTYRILAEKGFEGRIIQLGCQSNFLSSNAKLGSDIQDRVEVLSKIPDDKVRVAVTAGNPNHIWLKKLEQSLASLCESSGGLYVVQGPPNLLKISLGFGTDVPEAQLQSHAEYILGTTDVAVFVSWMRRNSVVFTSIPDWQRYYRTCDIVVGTRIHGCMTAIQAGVPAVCLVIDSRTRELCEQMNIPHADARDFKDGISVSDIKAIIGEWSGEEYDRRRRKLAADFVNFLRMNRISPVPHLSRIAGL